MQNSDAARNSQLEHLAQVKALSREVASGISAIERNDLKQFESHLAAQESICTRLAGTQLLLPPAKAEPAPSTDAPSFALLREIRQAHLALAKLNRVYAAVLKRAQRTTGMIASVYRSHGQGYERTPSAPVKHQTWSCEV